MEHLSEAHTVRVHRMEERVEQLKLMKDESWDLNSMDKL